MANAKYDAGRDGFGTGAISWTSNNIKAVLVDTGLYTVNVSTHANLSDIPSGARVATSGNLSGKTMTAGVADADDVTFSSVGGATAEAVVLYKDTGTPSTSTLIAYFDTASGLPVTPNSGNITIAWNNTSSKIFRL